MFLCYCIGSLIKGSEVFSTAYEIYLSNSRHFIQHKMLWSQVQDGDQNRTMSVEISHPAHGFPKVLSSGCKWSETRGSSEVKYMGLPAGQLELKNLFRYKVKYLQEPQENVVTSE